MAEIIVKHLDGNELSAVENLRLQARCNRDIQHWENIHYQFQEGLVLEYQWAGFRKNIFSSLAIDAYREYWEHESIRAQLLEIAELFRIRSGEAFFWTMDDVLKEKEIERVRF